jgi:hypothetical protein
MLFAQTDTSNPSKRNPARPDRLLTMGMDARGRGARGRIDAANVDIGAAPRHRHTFHQEEIDMIPHPRVMSSISCLMLVQ